MTASGIDRTSFPSLRQPNSSKNAPVSRDVNAIVANAVIHSSMADVVGGRLLTIMPTLQARIAVGTVLKSATIPGKELVRATSMWVEAALNRTSPIPGDRCEDKLPEKISTA